MMRCLGAADSPETTAGSIGSAADSQLPLLFQEAINSDSASREYLQSLRNVGRMQIFLPNDSICQLLHGSESRIRQLGSER